MAKGLIPRRLAHQLDQVPLPGWVADCCSIPRESTFSVLADTHPPSDAAARAAVQFFVAETMRRNVSTVAPVRVAPGWPSGPMPRSMWSDLPPKTRKPIQQLLEGLKADGLRDLTYGEVIGFRRLGVRGAVEFGLTIEGLAPPSVDASREAATSMDDLPDAAELAEEMRSLAQEDWTSAVFGSDPRWRDLLPRSSGSLSESLEQVADACKPLQAGQSHQVKLPFLYPVDVRNLIEVQQWLRAVTEQYARTEALALEDLLAELFEKCTSLTGQRGDAVLRRFGWAGDPPLTLEDAGKLLGVTRERLRQLEAKARKNLPSAPLLMPALDKALEVLAVGAPMRVEDAAALIREKGISRGRFSAESVMAAATDLGFQPQLCISETRGLKFITRSEGADAVGKILTISRRKSGASGAVSCADVAALVSKSEKSDLAPEDVARVLQSSPRFRQVAPGWFWATDIAPGRSRLGNLCRKMLAVTSPISVDCLRDGMKREFAFRNISNPGRFDLRVPPRAVLEAILRCHADFSVSDDGMVSPITPLDYRAELAESDRVLVDVLRSSPSCVLDRATLIAECVRRGVNPQTVNVDLTYSCVVEHVDTNIWTLRGADINPAAVEALRAANALRPRERRVMDFGWTAEGCLWVAAVVPAALQSFVIGCPGGGRAFVAGQKFQAETKDGTPCGKVGVTEDGTIYGLDKFAQIAGADYRDIVILEFDLSRQVVTLLLGDDELLDSYSTPGRE